MEFAIVLFLNLVAFVIIFGYYSIQDDESDINEYLEPYRYFIKTANNRTLLVRQCNDSPGSDGVGINCILMYYCLLYISKSKKDKALMLDRLFEKSRKKKELK